MLSDIYTDIEKSNKNTHALAEFSKTFQVKSNKLENEILNPLFEKINLHIEALSKIKISKDKPLEEEDFEEVKKQLIDLQKSFDELNEIGFYDDSQSRKLRNSAAQAIRGILLDIYNYHKDHKKTEYLLKIAQKISGTDSQKNIFNEDLKILEKFRQQDDISDKLTKYINEEAFTEALRFIESEENHTSNNELKNFLKEQRKAVIVAIFTKKHNTALDLFNKNNLESSKRVYDELIALIWKDIDIFNINKQSLTNILGGINLKLNSLHPTNFAQLDAYRDEVVKNIEINEGNTFETVVYRYFIDSNIHTGAIPIIKKYRSAKTRNNLIGWAVFIGIIFIVSLFNGNHTNTSNQTYNSSPSVSPTSGFDFSCLSLENTQMTGNTGDVANPTLTGSLYNGCSQAVKNVVLEIDFFDTNSNPTDTEKIDLGITDLQPSTYSPINTVINTSADTSGDFKWKATVISADPY